MATAEFNFDRDVRPWAVSMAKRVFKGRWDVDEQIADVIHEAWIAWQKRPSETPSSLAHYAVLHVQCGRHFRQSTRSCEGPTRRWQKRPQRAPCDPLNMLANDGGDPAEIGGFRIDFVAWFGNLTAREQAFVEAIVSGDTGLELAEKFGLSPGRVSQIRRELFTGWVAKHG